MLECSLVTQNGGGFALFGLFEVVSGPFRAVPTRSITRSFHFFRNNDFTECLTCQFSKKVLLFRFYYKMRQANWAALIYYKVGQVLRTTKCDKWYYKEGKVLQSVVKGRQVLQIRATFVTKWGIYYKVGQYNIY